MPGNNDKKLDNNENSTCMTVPGKINMQAGMSVEQPESKCGCEEAWR